MQTDHIGTRTKDVVQCRIGIAAGQRRTHGEGPESVIAGNAVIARRCRHVGAGRPRREGCEPPPFLRIDAARRAARCRVDLDRRGRVGERPYRCTGPRFRRISADIPHRQWRRIIRHEEGGICTPRQTRKRTCDRRGGRWVGRASAGGGHDIRHLARTPTCCGLDDSHADDGRNHAGQPRGQRPGGGAARRPIAARGENSRDWRPKQRHLDPARGLPAD